jgi:hydrogenase expression/formation protein HypE
MNKNILLNHGAGGLLTHSLIKDIIISELKNEILIQQTDAAILSNSSDKFAFTTDSYVVDPIFFPGGDIGKLSVAGTVNDLAVSGAVPKYLSLSFIIEEGFPIDDLKRIIQSISDTAKEANVKIVTGDTKVVNRGKADKIFINTSGIGVLNQKHEHISYGSKIISGDKIIINGTIADHGTAILSARENLGSSNIKSDCAPLNNLVSDLLNENINIKFMRDATRGGLGTVLKEIANENFGIMIEEEQIKIKDEVRGLCEIVGFDPLFLANEGKIVFIISSEDSEKAIKILRKNKYGTEASIIGEITSDNPDKVILNTSIGGRRMIDMLAGEQLPRIC